ncbi:MAG: HPr(Ser) kinase/phosphatase [Lachnospiraceae bacterium]
MAEGIKLEKIIKKMNLKNLTPNIKLEGKEIFVPEINRPALQLMGYYDHFDLERIQVIGNVEYSYLIGIEEKKREKIYTNLFKHGIPCIIICNGLNPDQALIDNAINTGTPIFQSDNTTSSLIAELIRWLNVQLAPCIFINGVLVDVYGVGVLIMGDSGVGKSEAALELMKHGHRLVTDNVVEIRKISEDILLGMAPDITRHCIEVRGVGIVDVKNLFGVQSVRETQSINLVITLEEWSKYKEYDRFGLDEKHVEFLGNKIICHTIPIRPGRNLAIIIESAAINHRQKQMGYNAAQELYKKVQEKFII